jgi:hypothetical protein
MLVYNMNNDQRARPASLSPLIKKNLVQTKLNTTANLKPGDFYFWKGCCNNSNKAKTLKQHRSQQNLFKQQTQPQA